MKLLCSLVLILFITKVKSIEIKCEFGSKICFHQDFYGCNVISINITSLYDSMVTSVVGKHASGLTHSNVSCFHIDGLKLNNSVVNFFPHGLSKYFPKLSEIHITNSGLQQLTKDDLKDFGFGLTTVNFGYNEITQINFDLFQQNLNIDQINLEYNKIETIGKGALDYLNNLYTLDFLGNQCYSDFAYFDRNAVIRLIKRINSHCGK